MSDNCDTDSDSEVGSNSSWTVLEEKTVLQTVPNIIENASQEENEIDDDTYTLSTTDLFTDVNNLQNETSHEPTQSSEINDENELQDTQSFSEIRNEDLDEQEPENQQGCITFEEYLKSEKANNKSVCFDEIPNEKCKSDKGKHKKCNSQLFGSLAIIGTVLAVAGVSFLCLLTPHNYSLTSNEIEKIRTECVPSKVLNNCNNETIPIRPLLCTNKENKLAIVDENGTLEKCFKKNDVSTPRAKKYLKSTKQFKAVKNINLMDDLNDVQEEKIMGPISFEDFHKEHRKYLSRFKKQEKKMQNILKTTSVPVVVKPKSAGQVDEIKSNIFTPTVSNKSILTNNNSNDNLNSKPSTPAIAKNQKLKEKKQFFPDLKEFQNKHQVGKNDKDISEIKFVRKINNLPSNIVKSPNQEKANVPNDVNQNDEYSYDYFNQSKIVCNILQDVMLLKMTSKIARNFKQKQGLEKVKKKDLRLKKQNRSASDMSIRTPSIFQFDDKPTIRQQQMMFKKLGITSDTKLNLLDELPFSKRKELLKNNRLEQFENNKIKIDLANRPTYLRNVHRDGYESHMAVMAQKKLSAERNLRHCDKNEKYDFSSMLFPAKNTQLICDKLNSEVEKLKKKQAEFFDKLKKQQKDRTEYLNLVRERQQQSIKDLIKERQFNTNKDASCGFYDVPIPSSNEIYLRLNELKEKKRCLHPNITTSTTSESSILSSSSCWGKRFPTLEKYKKLIGKDTNNKNEKMSKILDERVASTSSFRKEKIKIPMNSGNYEDDNNINKNLSKMNLKIPKEYIKIKEKYYERVGSYWGKREEYLDKRIEFMNNVSESIKEIVNFQKGIKKEKRGEKKESIGKGKHTESPSKSVMNIIKKAVTVFPDDIDIQDLKSQMSLTIGKEESLKSCASITGYEDSKIHENKKSNVFEFTASNDLASSSNNSTATTKDTLYNSLFGKQGQHIRKREMAIWYCNKISKRRKFYRDLTKHDMHRLNNNKKTKKEH